MSHAWMPLYVDDYLADTGHLTALEHGAYMLMIMHYWQKGGLPADERMIARVARLNGDQWAESRDVLSMLFDDGWKHKRIEEELAKASEIIGKRKAAATAMHAKRNAGAEQVQSTCSDTRVPPSPTPREEEVANATSKCERKRDHSEFDQWYQHYPHKVQRGAAERAFLKARKLADLDTLITQTCVYAATKPEDRQWQNPATWLNGKGWLDKPAGPAIRNGNFPVRRGVADVAMDKFSGKDNGSEGLFGIDGNAQRIPAISFIEPRPDDEHLRGGIAGRFVRSGH